MSPDTRLAGAFPSVEVYGGRFDNVPSGSLTRKARFVRLQRYLAATVAVSLITSLGCFALTSAAQAVTGTKYNGAACQPNQGVTVVVDFARIQDRIEIRCAPGTYTSIGAAFTAAGFRFDDPSFIQKIDGLYADPAQTGDWTNGYWGLYTSTTDGLPTGPATATWVSAMDGVAAGPVTINQAYLFRSVDGSEPFPPASPRFSLTAARQHTGTIAIAPPARMGGPSSFAASQAAAWIGRQLAANNDVLVTGGQTDWGLTADAVLALASVGVGGNQLAKTAGRLFNSGQSYIGPPSKTADNIARIAKLTLALQVAGLNPTAMPDAASSPRNLIANLRASLTASGQFGKSTMPFDQALVHLVLARTDGGIPANAVTWLKNQQCRTAGNANFGAYGWGVACTAADIDVTAVVVQALLASAQVQITDPPIEDANKWLLTKQDRSGGWAAFGIVNTNSTGLAGQLLRSTALAGTVSTKPGQLAANFIGGLQLTCPKIKASLGKLAGDATGAIAFSRSTWDDAMSTGLDEATTGSWLRATTQAVLGLGGPGLASLTAAGLQATLPGLDCAVPAKITLKLDKSRVTTGQKAKVTASAAAGRLNGTIKLTWGKAKSASKTVSVANLVSKRIALPKLKAGRHKLTATYTNASAPATAKVTLLVKRTKPKLTVKLTSNTIKVTVKAAGITKATGKVKVKVGAKAVTAKLKRGIATVRRAVFPTTAKRVTVTYKGDRRVAPKTVRKAL